MYRHSKEIFPQNLKIFKNSRNVRGILFTETQYLLLWYIMKLRKKREKSDQSIMTISLMNNLKQENNVIVNIIKSLELL